MKLRVVIALTVTVVLLPLTAHASIGWGETGRDPADLGCPDDGEPPCLGFDIRSTSLRIVGVDGGRRYLTITLRSYDRPLRGWLSGITIDASGGPKPDRRAFLSNPLGASMPQTVRCGIKTADPESKWREGDYRVRRKGTVASCRVPLRWVAPTKRPIRWHVRTDWVFPEPFSLLDRAPDHGWYP